MMCDESRAMMVAGWSGELDLNDRARLDDHLETCEKCRADAVRFGSLWERMGSLPAPEPSGALRVRWEATLESFMAEQGGEQIRPARTPRRHWFRWWPQQPVWQAGIALATLVIGVIAGALWQRNGATRVEIAELRQQVSDTRALVALSLLRENTASERLKGVDYSGRMARLEPDVVTALVKAVQTDPNVNVRLAAIDALSRASGNAEVRNSLGQSLPQQDSPLVQAALIDYLIDARDRHSASILKQLVDRPDLNPVVRQRATHALQVLSQ